MHSLTLYENNLQNASSVGWAGFPEYCQGPANARFVIHDSNTGLFYFVDMVAAPSKAPAAEVPVIKPDSRGGDCRTGTLTDISVSEINKLLGFRPNISDDPDKVKHSWGFTVDGVRCGVWDYKGSHRVKLFSTWGPGAALRKVFGDHYSAG